MRGTILLATALAAPLALPAVAQDMIGVAPVYSRIVAHPIPQGFVGAYENENDGSYIIEFVPDGQDVNNWQEMITLTGLKDVASEDYDPFDLAQVIGKGYQESCADTFMPWDNGPMKIEGAEAAHLVIYACGSTQTQAGDPVMEIAVILVVRGPEDFYTFQWAERSAAIDSKPRLDFEKWKPRAEMLLQLKLCEIVEGEEPPYPSCTG